VKASPVGAAFAASLLLAGCGGDSTSSSSGPHVANIISIPNISTGVNFSFDLGVVVNRPGTPGFYAFTDRNNKSVDRIDIASQTLTKQITGTGATAFTGVGANNGVSGPDGLNDIAAGKMYAGDVSSVKIINTATNTVTGVINGGMLAGSGVRADEGCVGSGPAAGTYIISSPEAAVPFMTVINTATDTVIATITFNDLAGAPSGGLEQCRYDAVNDLWFVNNDGTTANPHGEVDSMPGASIRALAPGATINYTLLPGVQMFPMTATPNPGCDPTGLALGPGTDIAVMCREGTTGALLLMQILNRLTGAIVASINAGGGDQLEYDPTSNRYYGATNRWTASGMAGPNGACSTASPCTPVLTIVDAATRSVVARVPTGNNAHSVAVDPVSGLVFVPFSSATSPAGCGTCMTLPNLPDGGVLVLTTQ
jgi:hypothetical protein